MLAQHGEQLTRHVGGEPRQPTIGDMHPLAVRAGQHQQTTLGQLGRRGERAEHLGFLTAHHVRQGPSAGRLHNPGHDMQRHRIGVDLQQAIGKAGQCGRAMDISRFGPATATADHAAGQGRQVAVHTDPVPDELAVYGGEIAILDLHDAAPSRARIDHFTRVGEQPGTQRRSSPVERDQARCVRGFVVHRR